MKRKSLISLWLLTLVSCQSLVAQDTLTPGLHLGFDPVSLFAEKDSWEAVVGTSFFLHQFESDFDDLPGELTADDAGFIAPILPLSYDRWRFVTLLNYRATWFDTTGSLIPDDNLHILRVPLVGLYDLSDKWLLGGAVMPAYNGDFSSGSDGFVVSTVLAAAYGFKPTLKIGAGVVYTYGFDDHTVLPAPGFLWKPNPKWSAVLFPPYGNISYRIGDDSIVSLFGFYDFPTWNVGADERGPDRDVQVKGLRLGLRLEHRLANRIWGYVSGGVNVFREFEVETTNSDFLQGDDIDPGAFIQAGFSIRF